MTLTATTVSTSLLLTENRSLRFATFFYLYVMQGVPAGFATTALANYLAGQNLSSARVGEFVVIVGAPWAFQFLWGPLIDRFQGSSMGRRRPWVIGSQILVLLASVGIGTVGDPISNMYALSVAFFVHSVCASVQDASVDAMAISTIPESERGRANGFMRGGFLAGIALGAAEMAYLIHDYSFQIAARAFTVFLLIFTVITIFIRERPGDSLLPGWVLRRQPVEHQVPKPSIGWLFTELFRGLMNRRSLLLFLPIVVVYACQNAFIRAYNIHLIQQLGWSDQSVSVLSGTYGMVLIIVIVLVGGWFSDRFGARRLLPFILVFHATYLLSMGLLGNYWSNPTIATVGLVMWNMMDPTLSVVAIPILMALCRPNVEGSQFTTYMAFINFSDIMGGFISGYAQAYVPASTIGLVVGCTVMVMLFIVLISRRGRANREVSSAFTKF